MKKTYLIVLFLIVSLASYSQFIDGKKILSNITFTDINNNPHDVYGYLSSGKNVILDFFKTDCSNCWAHHQSKYFEKFHSGHEHLNKVFALEVNDATMDLLNGVGSGTLGNWLTGTTYPTSVLKGSESYNNVAAFYEGTGGLSYGTPMLYLVCSDSVAWKLTTSMDSASLASFVKSKCPMLDTISTVDPIQYIDAEALKSNVIFKDMKGATINVAEQLSQKKIIVASFFRAGSSIDWRFNLEGAMEGYYQKYEKAGVKDSKVMMVEVDEKTDSNYVRGFGQGLLGSWEQRNNFSISNPETSAEILTIVQSFVKNGDLDSTNKIRTPLNFVVCGDNNAYRFDKSITTQGIRDIVTTKCYKWALGTNQANSQDADIRIEPNGNVHFVSNILLKDFQYTIYNSIGKLVYQSSQTQSINMNENGLSKGLYIIHANFNGAPISKKILVQ